MSIVADEITMRKAALGDKEMIYRWRNDPFLIERGSSGKLVEWEEHSKWFEFKIGDPGTEFLIVCFKGQPIGQLRFELLKEKTYAVTIYFLKEYTQKGLGVLALRKGIEIIQKNTPECVCCAFIKSDNCSSIKAFQKAGFRKIETGYDCPQDHVIMEYSGSELTRMRKFEMEGLKKFYDSNVKEHQDDIRSVAWGGRASQEKRFEELVKIGNLEGKSVLDVGCGLGDFYAWLKSRDMKVFYTGLDITSSMVKIAKRKFLGVNFYTCDFLEWEETEPCFDYVFASGIFNWRIPDHEKFIKRVITRMFDLSRCGVAFNIMSMNADFKEEQEYYADPKEMEAFCSTLSDDVKLNHAYMPHDFTVYIYKRK